MRADRHALLRRLRVLLACFAVLWGANVAVPTSSVAHEAAIYASQTGVARRAPAPRPALPETAAALRPALAGTTATAATALCDSLPPETTVVAGASTPIYLRHCALLL